MRTLLFILEKLGVFCLAAFLLAFFLMLAGAVAQLVYKLNLEYFHQL
jgi:hypothetical protein